MGAQISRMLHLHSDLDQPKIAPRPAERKADKAICPVYSGHRGPSVMNTLKHAAVVVGMVMTLLAALALFTGIFVVALKYAANEANQTFYEMKYRPGQPAER
jgi:hypothetical protein